MLNERYNLDTLDIIAVVVGAFVGLVVLTRGGLWAWEEIIVGGIAFIALSLKRLIITTSPRQNDAPVLLRMLFLLSAIAGAGAGVLSFVVVYTHETFRVAPTMTVFWHLAQLPLMVSVGCLALAFFIERVFLRI